MRTRLFFKATTSRVMIATVLKTTVKTLRAVRHVTMQSMKSKRAKEGSSTFTLLNDPQTMTIPLRSPKAVRDLRAA